MFVRNFLSNRMVKISLKSWYNCPNVCFQWLPFQFCCPLLSPLPMLDLKSVNVCHFTTLLKVTSDRQVVLTDQEGDFWVLKCVQVYIICQYWITLIIPDILLKLLASLMRNNFPERPSGASRHTSSKLNDCKPSHLRRCIALFAVAEGSGFCLDNLSCSSFPQIVVNSYGH